MTDKRLQNCIVVDKDTMLGYVHRVIVAGSRGYNDYNVFSNFIKEHFINDDEFKNNICFISGMANSGGDDLIIRFCEEYKIPIYPCPAQWNDSHGNLDRSAGYKRNLNMLDIGNRLVVFFDGQSNGTKHILENASKRKMKRFIVKIDSPARI